MTQRKRLTDEQKESILADWRAGAGTLAAIAAKHKVSTSTVHAMCQGVERDISPLVEKQVAINQEVNALSKNERKSFSIEVDRRTKLMDIIENAAVRNMQMSMMADCATQQDFKSRSDTIAKTKETVFGKQPDVQVNTQVNNTPVIDVTKLSIETQREIVRARRGT